MIRNKSIELRLLQKEEQKYIILRNAIQEGIDSGITANFDPHKHLKAIKSKRLSNA